MSDKKEIAKKQTGLIDLGITKAGLTKLKNKFKTVPDLTTKEGLAEFKIMNAECTPVRTKADKEAKIQKEAAQTHIKGINSVLNVIVSTVKEIEAPWRESKKEIDNAEAKIKQDALDAENARTAEIESKIGTIQTLTDGLLGATSEALQTRLDTAQKMLIDESGYGEFVDAAITVMGQSVSQLKIALTQAKALEEGQAALKVQQDEMAENQRKIDDANREAQEKMDLQQKVINDQIAEQEEIAEQQKKDLKAKEQEAELKARMPEDVKMRQYGSDLVNMVAPEIVDDDLSLLLHKVGEELLLIEFSIKDGTQDS